MTLLGFLALGSNRDPRSCKGGEPVRQTIEHARSLAATKGGRCLSTVFINSRSLLKWQCGLGHRPWGASYSNVRSGTWCPTCGNAVRSSMDELQAVARSRGGECLSDSFVNLHDPLRWRCDKGHEWVAEPNNVIDRARKSGSWCPTCAKESLRGKKRPEAPTIYDMRALAASRGGRCVSKFYVNAHTHLQWCCADGHQWNAEPANVRRGSWCPFCAGKVPKTLVDMKKLADNWKGRCVSRRIINVHSPLKWLCAEGHRFKAVPRNIQRGHWCPRCAHNARGTLKEMNTIAAKRGGKCLSHWYVNAQTPLKWRCAEGHVWFARPSGVKSGDWCAQCYRERGTSRRPLARVS